MRRAFRAYRLLTDVTDTRDVRSGDSLDQGLDRALDYAADHGTRDAPPPDLLHVDAGVEEIVIEVAEDTSVRQGSPDVARGGGEELPLGYCTTTSNQNMRTWLKFDLSALPVTANVIEAHLELYFYVHWGSQYYLCHTSSNDGWNELDLTWSSQPTYGDDTLDRISPFEEDDVWKRWNVTRAVQGERAGDGTLSLVVEGQDLVDPASAQGDLENWARSKEFGDGSLGPRLVLRYTTP